MTADIAFLRQKDNAFFDYVAHGPLPQVREQLTNTCGEADDGHPKFQWIWERHDIPGSAKETMYWDCVFLGKTLTKGSYPPPTPLPAFANIAVGIADARNTVHSPCANCNDNCSGRDIDCGKPWPEKVICEIEKSTIITACKAICTSTCWK